MKLVIDIPKEQYNMIFQSDETAMAECVSKEAMMYAIKNGAPYETVTEFADRCRECGREKVLDKIRAEIDRQQKWLLQAGCTACNVDIAFDAIKSMIGSEGKK